MSRLYLRILVALLATLALSLAAFVGVFFRMTAPAVQELMRGLQTVTLDQAIEALNEGGPPRAATRLSASAGLPGATHYLADSSGRDLVTGDDRSALLAVDPQGSGRPQALPGGAAQGDGRVVFVRADGRYRLITVVVPPFGLDDVLPYYALLLVAVGALCWILAVDIVRPLRRMATVVSAIGTGQLSTRTAVTRRDEIGDLARAVDQMAGRLELLLTAERRLLRDISHELRSPLTRLNLNLELLRSASGPSSAVARLQRDVDRLSHLVSAMLEVTRLEGEGLHPREEPVDMVNVAAEVVDDAALEADARGVRIETTLQPAVAVGDRELLRRAVENVLRNAVRYAPHGTTVEIGVSAAGDRIQIAVRDYGPGVPEADLARLGTPFFRVDDGRDAATGGSGLGLAIARRGIECHGGEWHLENAQPGLRVTMVVRGMASEPGSG